MSMKMAALIALGFGAGYLVCRHFGGRFPASFTRRLEELAQSGVGLAHELGGHVPGVVPGGTAVPGFQNLSGIFGAASEGGGCACP